MGTKQSLEWPSDDTRREITDDTVVIHYSRRLDEFNTRTHSERWHIAAIRKSYFPKYSTDNCTVCDMVEVNCQLIRDLPYCSECLTQINKIQPVKFCEGKYLFSDDDILILSDELQIVAIWFLNITGIIAVGYPIPGTMKIYYKYTQKINQIDTHPWRTKLTPCRFCKVNNFHGDVCADCSIFLQRAVIAYFTPALMVIQTANNLPQDIINCICVALIKN